MKEFIEYFSKQNRRELLKSFRCGLEKENIRVDANGKLSEKPHYFGSKICHPSITTDFAEMQMEISTPIVESHQTLLSQLRKLSEYITTELEKNQELLWPLSMPPVLDLNCKKYISKYPNTKLGRKKELYRKNLCYRYGSHMQMISGLHYNFSFTEEFCREYKKFSGQTQNELYLHIVRNFLRYQWILPYLFGASPSFHTSYGKPNDSTLTEIDDATYAFLYGTCTRMSSYGYQCKIQNQYPVSYNSIGEYIQTFKQLLKAPVDTYKELSSPFLLQIENEYYSLIRLKRNSLTHEKMIEQIEEKGIEYLEIRALDLQPSSPLGIEKEDLDFLHLFLVYLLSIKSPKLSEQELQRCNEDLYECALYGRDPKLKLHKKLKKLLLDMYPTATLLGKPYEKTLKTQLSKVEGMVPLPSSIVYENAKKGFLQSTLSIGKDFHKQLLTSAKTTFSQYEKIKQQSLEEEDKLIQSDALEDSTKNLINEAKNRGLQITILDANESLIQLKKGKKTEYVQQATKTRLDSYITHLLMGNKSASKQILLDHSVQTPTGKTYTSIAQASDDFSLYKGKKIVVKPNTTNFGIGIYTLDEFTRQTYEYSIEQAMKHSSSILIEEFVSGTEHRFLVIDNTVVGILERDPANVIGDGILSIEHLHLLKKERQIQPIEKNFLKEQGLLPTTVLKTGEKVYLRENSNISTGGDAIDRTDDVHKSYFPIAVQAAKAFNATICGVDMMIKDRTKAANKKNYAVIEVNYNPVLYFHEDPDIGKPRPVCEAVLDALGF